MNWDLEMVSHSDTERDSKSYLDTDLETDPERDNEKRFRTLLIQIGENHL